MSLKTFIGNIRGLFTQNFYEAARRWNPDRTYLPGYVQDFRFDVTEVDRNELVRKSRWFEKNDALANRLAELFVEFTVGANGPPIIPSSSDDDWNDRAGDWLTEFYPLADLNTDFGYGGIMTTAAWRRFFDGEFFILKTKGDTGQPRLQGIAAHRVATPPDKAELEGKTIVDGIQIDPRGRRLGYWVQLGDDASEFTFKSRAEIIHIFEPENPGQQRGIPILAPVMGDLHNFNDLLMYEMKAAKDAAEISYFVENANGQIDPSKMRQERWRDTSKVSISGTETTEERSKYFQNGTGGRIIAGKTGEKLTQFKSDRPTVTAQWYWEYLASRICAGVGISKLLVFPWSIQGTVARADLDLAATFFRSRFAPFNAAAFQIYLYTIGRARFSDVRIADAPVDWTHVNIRSPRAPNVDVGHNSAATIAELDSCLTTIEEQFALRGMDWRTNVRQRAREESFIDRTAKAEGIDPSRIRKAIAETLQLQMQAESQRQSQEDAQAA